MTDARKPGTPFQRSLGLDWRRTDDPGSLSVRMDLRPELCGPAGSLEGGVICTLADVARASACAMAMGTHLVATEHMAISFLAPGRIGPICATGSVLRTGAIDGVAEVRIVDQGRDGRLVAVSLVTVRDLSSRTPTS